jgi:uncharacterized membrane protein YfcA
VGRGFIWYDPAVLTLVALALGAGVAAGCLGALLGIGGGVVLIPLLNAWMALSFREAAAVSLVGVLATSSSVIGSPVERRPTNVHLAILLLVFSVLGATAGAAVGPTLAVRTLEVIFGVMAAVIAAAMLSRLDRRNVIRAADVATGVLGGRFHDDDTGEDVAYRVRRVPVALGVALAAGALASLVGIGGGVVIVPVLNAWCGVPMRVAASTSAFMLGITALPGLVALYSDGHLNLPIASATALGVLFGYRLGLWLSGRMLVRRLKLMMAGILVLVAIQYLVLRS